MEIDNIGADHLNILVVLGADSPFGLPLVLELEKKGCIVIASVANPEAVEPLEEQTQGYVKALVLDPYEVHPIPTHSHRCADNGAVSHS